MRIMLFTIRSLEKKSFVRKFFIGRACVLGFMFCFSVFLFSDCVAKVSAVKLTAKKTYTTKFFVQELGESFAELKLRTPSASWKQRGKESIVLTLSVDGKYHSDIVVYGGNEILPYTSMLGNVPPGRHALEISYAAQKSPVKNGEVIVLSISVTTIKPSDPMALMYKYSPIVYGREESSHSDVPLILYCTPSQKGNTIHYEYTMVFSNEDGGTGTFVPALMAQFGRTTDIEWIYAFDVLAGGTIVNEKFQGGGHETSAFTGAREGSHPLLRVSTTNNNYSQTGASSFRFSPVPVLFDDSDKPREDVMDIFSWSYRIMAEEMFAEGKVEAAANAKSFALSDARNYLYVDYNIKNHKGKPSLSFQVQLKDGVWYSSDHHLNSLFFVAENGRGRAAIELPQGTTSQDIAAFAFQGALSVDCEVFEARAFFLDGDYHPQLPFYMWKENVRLTKSNRRYEVKILKDAK